MSYLDENARTGRIILPDLVRAFALLGIVLVNVAYFAYPSETVYHAGGLNTGWDKAAFFGVNSLFLMKSYTLFSFMFGVGLAYQMKAAERHGAAFFPSYFRRMLGLILLGILHVTCAFLADILIIYGILGIVLFLFRRAGTQTLLWTGGVLVVIQLGIALLIAAGLYLLEKFSPEAMTMMMAEIQTSIDTSTATYSTGSFPDIAARRWTEWVGVVVFAGPLQAPGILGFFLLGLAAERAGILANPSARIWAKARFVFLPIGILFSVIGTWMYLSNENPLSSRSMFGFAIIMAAAPLSSFGYIGLIAKWSEGPMTRAKAFFARGGTSSLTAYLMQSLILSLVFCGYGLGLYGKIGAFGCIAMAVGTGLFTVSFASVWRTRFKRGPLEMLLRNWTYLGRR